MSTSPRTITFQPTGKAVTLDELAAFIELARRFGADGTETPRARLNFAGSTVKSFSLKIGAAPAVTAGDDGPPTETQPESGTVDSATATGDCE